MIKSLSVFFPVYNEEKNLTATVAKAVAVLENLSVQWEIIIVNDGSKDESGKIARQLCQSEARIRLVEHSLNRGYGAAFRSGVYSAQYDWIAFTDADGQFDFSEIEKFVRQHEETGADVVVGYYLDRQVPLYRKINTFFWETVVGVLFGLSVRDIDCAFKLFSKKVVKTIEPLAAERGAFISTEFLVKAKRKGFKISEVGVHHYPRRAGRGTGANLDVIIKSFLDLFRLWRKLK